MICDYRTNEERELKLRREDEEKYFDFQFPTQIFRSNKFCTANQLSKELSRKALKLYFKHGRMFVRSDYNSPIGKKYIYRCTNRECTAELVYMKRPETFNNLHHHPKYKDINKAIRQEISKFIINLSGKEYYDYINIKKWMQKFDLGNREAIYVVELVYWNFNTQQEILASLAYNNITIRRVSDQNYTHFIYLASESMKQNYKIYGDTISFQVSYSIVTTRSPIGKRFGIGFFYGKDHNLRLVLLSICLIVEENKENYKWIFEYFIQSMAQNKNKQLPKCFITDCDPNIQQALYEIKKQNNYDFYHLYDWRHILQKYRVKLQNQKNGQAMLELICNALSESNFQIYITMLALLKQNNFEIYEEFIEKQKMYSLCRLPNIFVGYALSTSFAKQLKRRSNETTRYKLHTGRLFFRILYIEQILIKELQRVTIINTGLIKYMPQEFFNLQHQLETTVMKDLILQFSHSKNCFIESIDPITAKVCENNSKQFILRYSLKNQHWVCECRYLYINGIPCQHIMRVLDFYDGSLEYYVNERWLHQKQQKIEKRRGPLISNKKRRP